MKILNHTKSFGVSLISLVAISIYFGLSAGTAFAQSGTAVERAEHHFKMKDYEKALPLYTSACAVGEEAGCAGQAKSLKLMRYHSTYTTETIVMLKNSCDGGSPPACYEMGVAHVSGHGVAKSGSRARAYYKKSCDLGDLKGCDGLAFYIGSGEFDVPADKPLAYTLFKSNCENGYPESCNGAINYAPGGEYSDAAMAMHRKGCAIKSRQCWMAGVAYRVRMKNPAYANSRQSDLEQARAQFQRGCDGGHSISCKDLSRLSTARVAASSKVSRPSASANASAQGGAVDKNRSAKSSSIPGITKNNDEIKYDSGNRYVGQTVDGKRIGEGIYYFANENRYEGNFLNGKAHGKGKFFYANGNRYEGEFTNGQITGKGIWFYANGKRYEGEVFNGKPHGEGTKVSSRKGQYLGSEYVGSWLDGKRHGKGKQVLSNGQSYEGDWVNGKKIGKGIYRYGSERYEGDWLNNLKSGKGKEFWQDKLIYEGDFFKNWRNGKGTYFEVDGRYEGDFLNNGMTGKGIYYYASGKRYEGDFLSGKKHGKGTLFFANGTRYVGDFVNDERTGKGRQYTYKGHRYEGDFVKGKFSGMGIYTFSDGERYEGRFKNGKREGWFTNRYADGIVEKRYFIRDEMMRKGYDPNKKSYAREYTSKTNPPRNVQRGSPSIVRFADELDLIRREGLPWQREKKRQDEIAQRQHLMYQARKSTAPDARAGETNGERTVRRASEARRRDSERRRATQRKQEERRARNNQGTRSETPRRSAVASSRSAETATTTTKKEKKDLNFDMNFCSSRVYDSAAYKSRKNNYQVKRAQLKAKISDDMTSGERAKIWSEIDSAESALKNYELSQMSSQCPSSGKTSGSVRE